MPPAPERKTARSCSSGADEPGKAVWLLAGASGRRRVRVDVPCIVPEAQERTPSGPQLDQVERAFVLRPAQPVLAERPAGEGGAEDAQRRLVRHRQDRKRRAFMARADLLQGGERTARDLGCGLATRRRNGQRIGDPCIVPFPISLARLFRRPTGMMPKTGTSCAYSSVVSPRC